MAKYLVLIVLQRIWLSTLSLDSMKHSWFIIRNPLLHKLVQWVQLPATKRISNKMLGESVHFQ